jgi:hypothetical protein
MGPTAPDRLPFCFRFYKGATVDHTLTNEDHPLRYEQEITVIGTNSTRDNISKQGGEKEDLTLYNINT